MSLFDEQDPELLSIREWARTTETGSRTDLSFYPAEETWSKVCSEADACLGLRCSPSRRVLRPEGASGGLLRAGSSSQITTCCLPTWRSGWRAPASTIPRCFRRFAG